MLTRDDVVNLKPFAVKPLGQSAVFASVLGAFANLFGKSPVDHVRSPAQSFTLERQSSLRLHECNEVADVEITVQFALLIGR